MLVIEGQEGKEEEDVTSAVIGKENRLCIEGCIQKLESLFDIGDHLADTDWGVVDQSHCNLREGEKRGAGGGEGGGSGVKPAHALLQDCAVAVLLWL